MRVSRLALVGLPLVLTFSLAGCGGDDDAAETETSTSKTTAVSTTTETTTSGATTATSTTTETTTGTAGATGTASATGTVGPYTMATVAQHATKDSCWAVVNNEVYDLTQWIAKHPGGPDKIAGMCGKDATAAFTKKHGKDNEPKERLATFKLGPLTK